LYLGLIYICFIHSLHISKNPQEWTGPQPTQITVQCIVLY